MDWRKFRVHEETLRVRASDRDVAHQVLRPGCRETVAASLSVFYHIFILTTKKMSLCLLGDQKHSIYIYKQFLSTFHDL